MTEKARRYNRGKLRYELLPDSLRHVVDVYTKGAHKYSLYRDTDGEVIRGSDIPIEDACKYELIDDGANNWRKGLPWSETIGSLKRHITAFERGDDVDDDLNTYHLGNAAFNILALLEFMDTAPHLDDRNKNIPKPVNIGLDIDGVICNFADGFKKIHHMSDYHWDVSYGVEGAIKDLKEDFWIGLDSLMDGKDLKFVPCCYVTARRSCKVEWIEEWLKKHNFPMAPIIITNGKSKIDHLKEMSVDIFIEDKYSNYWEINNSGTRCFLFDAFHNKKYDVGNDRLMSLNDLVTKFKITG